MSNNLFKDKYRIQSTRLKGWDYAQNGYYFVTICIKNRECVFGRIEKGQMVYSELGENSTRFWRQIPSHFPFVNLDEFIVMPNHIHGILVIDKKENMNIVETQYFASLQHGNPNKFGLQSQNLASVIRGFKIGVKKWATIRGINFVWQSRFYDRIIRDEKVLLNVRNYIINNPLLWETDEENPDKI